MSDALLSVRELSVVVHTAVGTAAIVSGVSVEVDTGTTVALVGESGCGKSTTALAVMGLCQPPLDVVGGQVLFEGIDVMQLGERERRAVRGARMAMVYQDPLTSLNPLMRIGDQIGEVVMVHGGSRREAKRRVQEVLEEVGIANPGRATRSIPMSSPGVCGSESSSQSRSRCVLGC